MSHFISDSVNEFLEPSHFCDSQSEILKRAVANITKKCRSPHEAAQRIFYWVRDNIKYELGLTGDKASETLLKGGGSCTNKANLAVAMFRCLEMPAAFHLMEVHAKRYLGVFSTPRFNQFMSEKSLHTYCSVKIKDRWIKIDPADDVQMSNSLQHLCIQASIVDFDGYQDARLHLNPEDVISDPGDMLPSVDHVLGKQRRLPKVAMTVFNLYIDYLRRHCIWNDQVTLLENDFFVWLREAHPGLHDDYVKLDQEVRQHRMKMTTASSSL